MKKLRINVLTALFLTATLSLGACESGNKGGTSTESGTGASSDADMMSTDSAGGTMEGSTTTGGSTAGSMGSTAGSSTDGTGSTAGGMGTTGGGTGTGTGSGSTTR